MLEKTDTKKLHAQIVRAFKNLGLTVTQEDLSEAIAREARDTADEILYEGNAYLNENGITDQGILMGSGVVEPNDGGGYDVVWKAEHASWINYGTDAHSVSTEGVHNIEAWVRRKLKPSPRAGESEEAAVKRATNSIVWSIRKQGMDPKPYADVAVDTVVARKGGR